MVGQRPTPEQVLQRSEEAERKENRGKLKIYLGAAPGVGKTYTMLNDAIEKRESDLDVVVGIVESHGRHDIESKLKSLEALPRQAVHYRNKVWLEFDLDAALKRNPGLILIDEMAHSNAPGLRHDKRWQDIKECLDRGIDVYTTLNVQHIESLKDDVAQIIQTTIRETVPDSMIEMANTIEVVDLPPEELLKRLHDGKVYFPQQAELAVEHFFRKGNLIALRELALRTTAERVGTDVLLYRQSEGITQIWPTKDKILACVGPKLGSLKLIRAAKRMATSLQADLIAVYVDTPIKRSSSSQRNRAIQNLRLAEQLGATTHVLTGYDIVKELMNFAREQNVTQIMLRKNIVTRWRGWFSRSLADEVVRHSGEIDVYIMPGRDSKHQMKTPSEPSSVQWKPIVIAMLIITLATLLNIVLYPYFTSSNFVMIYLLSIFGIALLGRSNLSIFSSILCVIVYDFFFVSPFYSLSVSSIENDFTLIVMLGIAQLIAYLTIMTRRQSESARLVQHQTTALYTLSRQLTNTRGVGELVALGANYISDVFAADVIALLPKANHLDIHSSYPPRQKMNTKELSVAQWVFEMGLPAGLGTDTLSFSKALYLPLLAAQGTIGVLRIQPKSQQLFTPEQLNLLDSCVNQITLALEVDRLHEKTRRKELKVKTEQARISVLEAISKDLHTSLNIINSGIGALKKKGEETSSTVGKGIDYEVEKLSKLNNNILRMIELESQDINIQKSLASLKDVIQVVLKKSNKTIKDREIHTHFVRKIPSILMSEGLIQEVLINLIDNAVKFTPPKSPIAIFVILEHNVVRVSVEDTGPGVAPDERTKLFEKFYRGKQVMLVGGLGLGLAICQKIITIHGGKIWVENIEGKGAAFRFTLPI